MKTVGSETYRCGPCLGCLGKATVTNQLFPGGGGTKTIEEGLKLFQASQELSDIGGEFTDG